MPRPFPPLPFSFTPLYFSTLSASYCPLPTQTPRLACSLLTVCRFFIPSSKNFAKPPKNIELGIVKINVFIFLMYTIIITSLMMIARSENEHIVEVIYYIIRVCLVAAPKSMQS